jgi:hypothetical protein
MKTISDHPAGQILLPLLDVVRSTMKRGSYQPIGIGKVGLAPNINDDRRSVRA